MLVKIIEVKNGRLSFASHRQPATGEKEPKYKCKVICSEDTTVVVSYMDGTKKTIHHSEVPALMEAIAKDKWGKVPAKYDPYLYSRADQKVGSRDAVTDKEGNYYEGYDKDTWFFAASVAASKCPDGLLIVDRKRVPLPASSGHPISGDYVNVRMSPFAYEFEGKKGVSGTLEGILYLREGVPFGAKMSTADDFEEEEFEDEEEEDSTGIL